jgi:serine phosphatase RsbU (regulator of sigma subunit)
VPRHERQPPRPVRTRLAALAACCALAPTCAAIASARPIRIADRGGQGYQGGGAGQGAGAHESHGGGQGRWGGGSEQGGGAHESHGGNSARGNPAGNSGGGSSGGNAGAGNSGAGAGSISGGGNHGHSSGGAGHGRGKEAAGSGAAGQGPARGGQGGAPGQGAGGEPAGESSRGGGHGDHGRARNGHGSGEGGGQTGAGTGTPRARGRQSQSQTGSAGVAPRASNSTPRAAAVSAAVAPPAPAATSGAAAIPPVTAPSPATPPAAPSAASGRAPAGTSSHPQPATRARRARRRKGRSGGSHTAATVALPTVLVASPLAAGAPSGAGSGTRRGASRGGRRSGGQPSTQPPIVQTITKIVGVIPLAVWIAGGALVAIALALAAGSRLLAKRARRLERQRGELLADVGLLQTTLMPAPPAGPGPVSASVAYRPADGPAAGGDFYDVFALEDGRLATIVGDVSGHGREALPHTALVRFTLRAYLEAGLSPREALRTAGAVLERQLDGALVSAVLATYQPRERTLVYACAGHPPPIVLGTRALAPLGACASPPLGTGLPTGTRQTVLSLPGAAQVCFHTDGVTDARVGQDLYGSQRLAAALASLGPAASAPALLDRVAEQTDARPDDMAACLLSVQGGPVEPATLVQELELWGDETARERAERFLLACGLELSASAALAGKACAQAERVGSVLIEARPAGPGAGAPSAHIREDLPDIHASDTRRLATVGGAR